MTVSVVSQDLGRKEKDCAAPLTFIGPALPLIPARLVEKFSLQLSELLPDHIRSLSGNPALDNEDKASSKQIKWQVTTILQWVQCFSLYTWLLLPIKIQEATRPVEISSLIVEARL